MKQRYKIILLAIPVGLIFGIMKEALRIPNHDFQTLSETIFIFVLFLIFAIQFLRNRPFQKKLNSLLPILQEEKDPDCYLNKLNALLATNKARGFQSTIQINRCAAYCKKRIANVQKKRLILGDYKNAQLLLAKAKYTWLKMDFGDDLDFLKERMRETQLQKNKYIEKGRAPLGLFLFHL